MKIKKEISINLTNSNLNIYKLGPLINKVKISSVNVKPEGNYLELEYETPKYNTSLLRNKSDKIILYSYGFNPVSSYYLLKGLDDEECNKQNVYKLNSIYKFNTKFKEELSDKATLQFRKVESREEIEHRKRNINYKLKVIENEPFKKLEYKQVERNINKVLSVQSKSTSTIKYLENISVFDNRKIERCIKNRVVVNLNDLYKLFPDHQEDVKLCLQKLTFYFKGRYILKDKFYDKNLQKIRKEILEAFENSDSINFYNLSTDYNNMLHELCTKQSNKYILKGIFEEKVIDFKNINLVNKLKDKCIFTLQEIKEISGLDIEDVYKFILENNIQEIINNFYCVYKSQEIEEVLKIYEKGNIKKSEINDLLNSKELNTEDFFKALDFFFVLKRSTWVKK